MKNLFYILILVSSSSAFAQVGLVAHWSFDSMSGSKFHNHINQTLEGTIYGATQIAGPVGNALYFDGVDDFLRVPENNQNPPQYVQNLSEGSISLWFKVENIPTVKGIRPILYYGRENPCNFFDAANEGLIIEVGHSPIHNQSKRLYFTTWTNGCTLPSFCYDSWGAIQQNTWHHYIAVVGSNYNTGYLNGQEMVNRNYNFGASSSHEFFSDALAHQKLWIGKGYWDSQEVFFKGAIDEIKIFNRVITPSEALMLYQEGNVSVGLKEHKNNTLEITPNPANDFIKVKTSILINEFLIYNVFGDRVMEVKSNNEDQINIEALASGVYFLYAKGDHDFIAKRFVVTRP